MTAPGLWKQLSPAAQGMLVMRKLFVSFCLLLGGLAVFVLGSPYYAVFPTNRVQAYILALALVFLVAALTLRRSHPLARFAPSAYALFTASATVLFLNTGVLNIWVAGTDAVQHIALDKLGQFLHLVPVILVLTLVARDDLKSLFIARGKLKAGLVFAGVSFVLWAVLAYLLQSGASGFPELTPRALGYVLHFVFCNSSLPTL